MLNIISSFDDLRAEFEKAEAKERAEFEKAKHHAPKAHANDYQDDLVSARVQELRKAQVPAVALAATVDPDDQEDTEPDWKDERAKVIAALEYISPTLDYLTWRREVFLPLVNAFGDSCECRDLLYRWSCQNAKYQGRAEQVDFKRQWEWQRKREATGAAADPKRLNSFYAFAFKNGWRWVEPVAVPAIPEADKAESLDESLADQAVAALKETFASFKPKHNPSDAQWLALRDLAAHLEAMATGTAKPMRYLSSLDPGIGKTQTIAHFLKALNASEKHQDVGAIIFVGRRREIPAFVNSMGLDENDYAVCVSGDPADKEAVELNALGNQKKDQARVLLTTHQMLDALTKRGAAFADLGFFHFKGKPRLVRIWDETCLAAKELTLDLDTVRQLERTARKANQRSLAEVLQKDIADIEDRENEFVAFSELSEDDALLAKIYAGKELEAVYARKLLNGMTVNIVRDGQASTAVHYVNTLPDDIKPMVITDASGRIKQTYAYEAQGRGDLLSLPSAMKNYSNLTTYLWERTGSQTAWRNDTEELLSGIASVIESKPDNEEWLVFHMRESKGWSDTRKEWVTISIPELVRAKVRNPDRLKFVHWGGTEFRATNDYNHMKNVVLTGLHFLPKPAYHALARAALGLPSNERLEPEALRNIEKGEHANFVLQAVCRSAVRQSAGSTCGECSVYVIADKATGIPGALRGNVLFPGSKVETWLPEGAKAKGKVGDALAWLRTRLVDVGVDGIPVSEIMDGIGDKDRSNFNKRVVANPVFQAGLKQLGLIYEQGKGTMSWIRKEIELPC